ncbi:MAG: hypothetical protein Hyperionvirus11_59 [Hyperionvirus sp.]|uniref:Uncharacterized protein n=1 Tax=Hyperionvirus sp. TaxID=2487770 RepID=A0A3G5A930_9VIRU|nr:MAG: hypothetical protein Hyperionvirus11_59 [Hyperionvirus sp.]
MTYVDNIYLGENLENLSSVRTLILKGCDGVKDNTLKNFISVDHLEISHLRIYGSSFAYLRKLTHLTINRCPILNTNMQYLSKITNLEIRCCPKISDSGINYLKNLREIIIEEDEPTLLTERAFRPLMFLKKIRIVAGSNITDWNNHLRSRGVMIVPKI